MISHEIHERRFSPGVLRGFGDDSAPGTGP
jgi:hypothetical protein